MKTEKLSALAKTIRSKNAGVDLITFDIIFRERATYERVKRARVLTRESVCRLYGVRPEEQLQLAKAGYTVRVYVPYGTQWYGYLMRRLAERPANLTFFARALRSRS